MVQLRSIKFALVLVLLSDQLLAGDKFSCKEIAIKSLNVKASEKASLCTLRDDTYFISRNCQDLSCEFFKRLKDQKLNHDSSERPGISLCKLIGGAVEEISYSSVKFPVQRCVFSKEKDFISLNLLESWDGKVFKGPSKPLKM